MYSPQKPLLELDEAALQDAAVRTLRMLLFDQEEEEPLGN